MSRVGRLPIMVPKGVNVEVKGNSVHVKGPKGELKHDFSSTMSIKLEDQKLSVNRSSDETQSRALHGLTRSLINNMIVGVSKGFEKTLEVNGVGYRAEMDGKNLVLYVGYSHPVVKEPPEGISFEVDSRTRQIKILGYDKQAVGQVAADVRKIRPPEPYKGKGIRYIDETVRHKAGKAGKV